MHTLNISWQTELVCKVQFIALHFSVLVLQEIGLLFQIISLLFCSYNLYIRLQMQYRWSYVSVYMSPVLGCSTIHLYDVFDTYE